MDSTNGNMMQELTIFYRDYKIKKICLEHYETELKALAWEMEHGAPQDITGMSFDGQPHAAARHPNFETTSQKYLDLGLKIEVTKRDLALYDVTFDRFHEIFTQYSARKYSVLVMRINGKSNKEIAADLNLSPERVRHIISEINKEYKLIDPKEAL